IAVDAASASRRGEDRSEVRIGPRSSLAWSFHVQPTHQLSDLRPRGDRNVLGIHPLRLVPGTRGGQPDFPGVKRGVRKVLDVVGSPEEPRIPDVRQQGALAADSINRVNRDGAPGHPQGVRHRSIPEPGTAAISLEFVGGEGPSPRHDLLQQRPAGPVRDDGRPARHPEPDPGHMWPREIRHHDDHGVAPREELSDERGILPGSGLRLRRVEDEDRIAGEGDRLVVPQLWSTRVCASMRWVSGAIAWRKRGSFTGRSGALSANDGALSRGSRWTSPYVRFVTTSPSAERMAEPGKAMLSESTQVE